MEVLAAEKAENRADLTRLAIRQQHNLGLPRSDLTPHPIRIHALVPRRCYRYSAPPAARPGGPHNPMLENLRRQGASIFIYLIFGLLIAIFVINIGPGSGKRGDGGCSGRTNTILTVDGYDSTQTAYHVAYSGQNYVYQQAP